MSGARQHNLQNFRLRIPRKKVVVITGLSGSGKSSLVFDTLYAEWQRRYVESLSAYTRQFLDEMKKPDVDFIEGLSLPSPSSSAAPGSTYCDADEPDHDVKEQINSVAFGMPIRRDLSQWSGRS
jgi:excinuclease ABC subunit A